jgi:ribosomal protein L29
MKEKERTIELRGKSEGDLQRILIEDQAKVQELVFKVSQNQLKDIREIRVLKKEIARINTFLHTNAVSENKESMEEPKAADAGASKKVFEPAEEEVDLAAKE